MDKDFHEKGSEITASKAVGKIHTERAYFFTDSKITHIESCLNRAHELEEFKVRRTIPKILYTIGIFILGLGIKGLEINSIITAKLQGDSFSKIYQDHIISVSPYLWITIGGFIIVILTLLVEYIRKSEFKSFISEVKLLIENVKKISIEQPKH